MTYSLNLVSFSPFIFFLIIPLKIFSFSLNFPFSKFPIFIPEVKNSCFKASDANILLFAFFSNNLLIKSLQLSLTFFNLGLSKLSFLFNIFENISSSVSPIKGGSPVNNIYIIIPQAHSSHSKSYFSLITSGEQ